MITRLLDGLTLASALGAGLMAGVFFAFSSFVMPALGRLPPGQATAAMQSINRLALTPPFLPVLVGTAVVGLVTAGAGVYAGGWVATGSLLRVAGAVVYAGGCIGVTRAAHIPRNEALDRVDPAGPEAPAVWARHLKEWTAWNHVRTVACLLAALLFTLAWRAR
jgi:uncharacterized membrane protein